MTADIVAITDITSDTAGAIVLWRLSGDTSLESLKQRFVAQGLDESLLPETPSYEKALRRAVKEYEGKRMLVRPLPGKRAGYALVEESTGDDNLEYNVTLKVQLVHSEAGAEPMLDISGVTRFDLNQIADGIRTRYNEGLQRITSEDTAGWLCEMVRHVKAVPLRDTGGVYFVPRQTLGLWRNIVTALRKSSATYVAEIPALKSSEAVDTILDSLQREADQFLGTMEQELKRAAENKDGMGSRAIQTRVGRCESTAEKLGVYEKLLGIKLDNVRARLEALQANLAAAALIAHANEDAA